MKKFYIIQSTKKSKNGHVSHLMILENDYLHEISPRTGKKLNPARALFMKLDDLKENEYTIIKPEHENFVGAMSFPFFEYIIENYCELIAQ